MKFKELKEKYDWPAGLASALLVGSGQFLKGRPRKGLRLLLLFYFFIPAVIYTSLALLGRTFVLVLSLCIIFGIILWLHSVSDALKKKK